MKTLKKRHVEGPNPLGDEGLEEWLTEENRRPLYNRIATITAVIALLVLIVAVPGGFTGWALSTALILAGLVGWRSFTGIDIIVNTKRFVLAALLASAALGYAIASIGAAPAYELTYRSPATPAAWTVTDTDYANPDGLGDSGTAKIVTYSVPGTAEKEARAYVDELTAKSWSLIPEEQYRTNCPKDATGLTKLLRYVGFASECKPTGTSTGKATVAHLTHNGITLTVTSHVVKPEKGKPQHLVKVTAEPTGNPLDGLL